ncbi:hypothetical protein MycrhDRAFT_4692 [Mycolicibacterium rhodesiae JS60]|nr:hypothetical protein MycrhDRAFT_4692 [Mycolicibacterium rhodesiae JS60]
MTMTVDTQLLRPIGAEVPETTPAPAPGSAQPVKAGAKKAGKKTKTLELTLTVTGTADGEWHAELKRGTTYVARNLAVAAAAVSRAARELHDDLATPIDAVIEEARSEQAARVAALEAELEAARRALANLD